MTINRIQPDNRQEIAQSLRARFAELHHRHAPVGIFAAPGRVNLIADRAQRVLSPRSVVELGTLQHAE